MSNKNVLILMFFFFLFLYLLYFCRFSIYKDMNFYLNHANFIRQFRKIAFCSSREVTLLPLQGDYSMILVPRGVADRSARANRFWAVSPKI